MLLVLVSVAALLSLSAAADPACPNGTYCEGSKQLILVQAVWRHGDRAPTESYPADKFQEDSWDFGGSGFGQLSPIGMRQHVVLGQKIRARYVDDFKYLKPKYDSKEIYIRSTDVNRTIISALSNMIGMYGQARNGGGNEPGKDYPSDEQLAQANVKWPTGYIPIAIHNVDYKTDYIGNADDKDCPRQDWLWKIAQENVPEIKNDIAANQNLLDFATANCGETVTVDNLWVVTDGTLIESIHFGNASLMGNDTWVNADIYQQLYDFNARIEEYQNGKGFAPYTYKGQDLGLEIIKLRGGSLTNDILMHMTLKDDCLNDSTSKKCKWANRLKYYVYSAHDTTLYGWFSCLGIEEESIPGRLTGYPHYSAAVLVEEYKDLVTGDLSFKFLYHSDETQNFTEITNTLPGCNGTVYCPIAAYKALSDNVLPQKPWPELCQLNPDASSATSVVGFVSLLLALVKLS